MWHTSAARAISRNVLVNDKYINHNHAQQHPDPGQCKVSQPPPAGQSRGQYCQQWDRVQARPWLMLTPMRTCMNGYKLQLCDACSALAHILHYTSCLCCMPHPAGACTLITPRIMLSPSSGASFGPAETGLAMQGDTVLGKHLL